MPLDITGGDHVIIMAVELMTVAEQLTGAVSGPTALANMCKLLC